MRTTIRTGICCPLLTYAKYVWNGTALSRAKAQAVREVDVRPAAFAATATIETIKESIAPPATLLVVFSKSCMNGNRVGQARRETRSSREKRRTKQ